MTDTDTKMDPEIDQNLSLFRGRRQFIGLMGAGAAAVALAACGGGDDDEGASDDTTTTAGEEEETTTTAGEEETTTTTEAAEDGAATDLGIAQLAAGLEVLAVQTYGAALDAAGQGALGEVPPAVATYVTTAMAQHQEHLDTWNGILAEGGEAEVTEPNADLKPTVDGAFAEVTDAVGAATLARMLESIAAATYFDAIGLVTGDGLAKQAGSMFIVDRQHVALLDFALGEYPIPDVFANNEGSAAG